MLEARNLAFGYDDKKEVIKDVSLSLKLGDTLCLLGPNGTGKTSLLKLLLGLNKPKKGEVLLNDKPLSSYTLSKRAKELAYVPQALKMSFSYTTFEVVLMARSSYFSLKGASLEDLNKAKEALELLNISHLKNKVFNELSGGWQQMVFLARAVAQDAKFLIMDEPTASLDFTNQLKMLELIKKLSSSGYGVLFSSHQPEHALRVCNKVIMLKDGYVLKDLLKEEINSSNLSELYGCDVRVKEVLVDDNPQKVCVPLLKKL